MKKLSNDCDFVRNGEEVSFVNFFIVIEQDIVIESVGYGILNNIKGVFFDRFEQKLEDEVLIDLMFLKEKKLEGNCQEIEIFFERDKEKERL